MGFEIELYEERRRKWRRSAFWKGFAIASAIIIVFLVIVAAVMGGRSNPTGPHIARFFLTDVIYDNPDRDALFAEMAESDDVKALILRINSPGGTTAGSEALFDSLRKVAASKPVVAVLGEVAASGGYIAAISADHIIARGNTVTGSIGVIMEYPDVTVLMERLGIEMQTIRSSDIKGGPSPFRPLTEEARAEELAMVEEANQWFRGLVSERRGLQGPALDAVATGGVFSGRQAVENGLIDAIGGEDEALAYLESLDAGLVEFNVETWELPVEDASFLGALGLKLGINPLFNGLSGQSGPRLYSLKR